MPPRSTRRSGSSPMASARLHVGSQPWSPSASAPASRDRAAILTSGRGPHRSRGPSRGPRAWPLRAAENGRSFAKAGGTAEDQRAPSSAPGGPGPGRPLARDAAGRGALHEPAWRGAAARLYFNTAIRMVRVAAGRLRLRLAPILEGPIGPRAIRVRAPKSGDQNGPNSSSKTCKSS